MTKLTGKQRQEIYQIGTMSRNGRLIYSISYIAALYGVSKSWISVVLKPERAGRRMKAWLITVVLLLLLAPLGAYARNDGQWVLSDDLRDWIRGLSNQKGSNCCDFADGARVEDPDWEHQGEDYRVKLAGEWLPVPPDAVIRGTNRIGYAIVWRYTDRQGIHIRCFLPGSDS